MQLVTISSILLCAAMVFSSNATAAPKAAAAPRECTVQWIGTATALMRCGKLTIVTDPAMDEAGQSYDIGIAILEKTSGPAMPLSALPRADVVLLSHDQHADNLDIAGRAYLKDATLTVTTPEGAHRLGGNARGLGTWASTVLGDITITAVPAQHGPNNLVQAVGPVTGFIIAVRDGPTLYFSGDTIPFGGTNEIIRRYRGKIDYALLNVGAVNTAPPSEHPVYATMRSVDAIDLARALDVGSFSLMHADSWKHFSEDMPQAIKMTRASDQAERFINLSDHQPHVVAKSSTAN